MTVELTMLVWAVVLTIVQLTVAVVGTQRQVPLAILVGNREAFPTVTGWAGRARRAYANMLEALLIFGLLVTVAAISGRSNPRTELAAEVFVWARLAYAALYIGGARWARTLAWAVALGCAVPFLRVLLAG